ncbi:SDR family oxidoreductase [Pendulispora rubella]|uniref:3-dehydrosphinganine reductase n=1 Tax=Pendulispora rubella TaxID=2741070 RepID=A0ABZ2KWZ2_9BACT
MSFARGSDYFAGRRVVITGGSSGIGLSLAHHLAAAGADLCLVARRPGPLEMARAAIVQAFPSCRVCTSAVDVADEAAVTRGLAPILEDGVDVLLNVAGVTRPGRFIELPPDEFRSQMDANYFGVVHMCRAVVPHFIGRRAGHIVNVGSLAGIIGIYGYSAYCASKFALTGFSQSLRAELWPYGIRVSIAQPPDTDTPMLVNETPLRPPETAAIAGTAPVRSADEVARAILRGAARGDFEIWGDRTSQLLAFLQGATPWLARWVCDAAQRKVMTRNPSSSVLEEGTLE